MITKINLNKVASYKTQVTLETDKKVNLIYGLNGTGKSTLSNYLLKKTEDKFKDCSIEGLDVDYEILVYNQTFIQENFFESESLKGIFTLSKKNKEAETKIVNAQKEIKKFDEVRNKHTEELDKEKTVFSQNTKNAKNTVWKIKTDYSGGDRVLEFCLEGHKGSKDNLFSHILSILKPSIKPTKSIDELKTELQAVSGENAQKYDYLPKIIFSPSSIESEELFSKKIVGNENSSVSGLITQLGNSDWVKEGLNYLTQDPIKENEDCPFCQEKTISNKLIESIKNYFDASYEADINSLKNFLKNYVDAINTIPEKIIFEASPKLKPLKKDFEIEYNKFIAVVKRNKKKIEDKIKTPSLPFILEDSIKVLENFNEVIDKINKAILEHNNNIEQKATVKINFKKTFWEIMRWDYDQTISLYIVEESKFKSKLDSLKTSIQNLEAKITEQRTLISEQQRQTVNIEEAVANINNGLVDMGITDFKIENHSENLYKIIRGDNKEKVFRSLSEGEKMIISFLYFIEMCRGKKEATETGKKKIIVIDDPISSLSHIYVFNIGRLIHSEFFRSSKYEQIFLLTHSLYFFYEMTDTNKDRRKENQKLFRITKNSTGSNILELSYEEIQNDYHSYWTVIKDEKMPKALIANCMRNIIEYFFNFVEKKDFNKVFQKPIMQENRFQAFGRYMNRESHSLGQNIFDIKEFNYTDFKDAFSLVFKENGYAEHYKRMIR